MSSKIKPTSGSVGRLAPARTVPRAARSGLINPAETAPRRRVFRVALCTGGTPCVKSINVLRLVLLIVGLWCSQMLGASDPNRSQFEESPPQTDAFHAERNKLIANERQELYRKRVPLGDAVGPHVPALFSPGNQDGVR